MPSICDLRPGKVFRGALVIKRLEKRSFLFRCKCGEEFKRDSFNAFRSDEVLCLKCSIERRSRKKTTHGHRCRRDGIRHQTKEYTAWLNIKHRCYNPNRCDYERYGGRGIRVCDRWLESFSNFLDDMGSCPGGYSIDRIDNNADYAPENCKWSNNIEQANNKRNNHFIEHMGKTLTVSQWSRELGVNRKTIVTRLRDGWDPVRAISTPSRSKNRQR